MKFSDLFVPRWQHSNPEVRIKAIDRITDISLLTQISEKDEEERVRQTAEARLAELQTEKVTVRT